VALGEFELYLSTVEGRAEAQCLGDAGLLNMANHTISDMFCSYLPSIILKLSSPTSSNNMPTRGGLGVTWATHKPYLLFRRQMPRFCAMP
jgi:hypothetical protein